MRKGLLLAALAAAALGALAVPAQAAPRGCDPLDRAHCLAWPNDHFRKDGRLALRDAMMPRNTAGTAIRAADYNRSDGFSPGQTIVTVVPGLDLRTSRAVPQVNMSAAFAKRAPIVVIDAKTGKRQLIWAELDSQATGPRRALLIHPGANWREGRRYIVALRNLKDGDGRLIGARGLPALPRRPRPGAARATSSASSAGSSDRASRASAYLAWDFTVASRSNLTSRLLSMRNRAFAELGDTDLDDFDPEGRAPAFTVTSTQDIGAVRARGRHVHRPASSTEAAARWARASRSTAAGCRAGSRAMFSRSASSAWCRRDRSTGVR